jgi:hypothetical protein
LDVAHWLRRLALWADTYPISGSLSPTCCWPFCLSSLCLLKVHRRSAPCSFLLLQCTSGIPTPLCCVLVFSSLFILPRGLCWFIPGVVVGIPCATYLLTCWSAGLELASSGAGALLFSQCNVAWRNFGLGIQGVILILLGVFLLPSVAPASQQNF